MGVAHQPTPGLTLSRLTQHLTPGVKMWVKYTAFSEAAASPNPQDGSNPSTGEWLGCGRKRAEGLPNTLGF